MGIGGKLADVSFHMDVNAEIVANRTFASAETCHIPFEPGSRETNPFNAHPSVATLPASHKTSGS